MSTPQLPGVAELLERFRTVRYTVFRLETLQHYAGSGENEAIAAFERGDREPPPDPAEDEYAGMVRTHRAAGKAWQRVHVVREPLSAYLAYELTWEYGPHVAAGEDIHIIDATCGWPNDVPLEDFWLFDSRHLFDLRYAPDGTWLGVEPVSDPSSIAKACFVRDAAWQQSIMWADFMAQHPELELRVPRGG